MTDDRLAVLMPRAKGEFLEMPGLKLTPAQAARLWAIDAPTSASILDGLARDGFLSKTARGAYYLPASVG